ncbi:type III polyketide synthase [Sphingomonas sp. C3-2]|uniref:type III polyketide synthase n=1 Tax=Sphingomonas sp. C3-2 TaxID=3062169 RepID=UPI00294B6316|nr:type III polyketide synthase [Sphingomonas sp. C3-2]WOK35195.1 type III polyketide synthase [Sphingomonas sp. C3-2]
MPTNARSFDAPTPHINAIATAIPDRDIHQLFIDWAEARLPASERAIFRRMTARSGIAHRWSILDEPPTGPEGLYGGPDQPPTSRRMALYTEAAPILAGRAIAGLAFDPGRITHLVLASCTGFSAPGIDQIVAQQIGLSPHVERLLVGFMGCYAAVAALRSARHIVRSDPEAQVLVITVELSSLHLTPENRLEALLAMLQFGDGAAAALVSARPEGLAMEGCFATTIPDSGDLIRWTIGDHGFLMHLSGAVPGQIGTALAQPQVRALMTGGRALAAITHWAVHAGGRSVLDAVEHGLDLSAGALDDSRAVLRACGNMSSSTLMFVLARMLADGIHGPGIALAFGPGLAAEGFRFGPPR